MGWGSVKSGKKWIVRTDKRNWIFKSKAVEKTRFIYPKNFKFGIFKSSTAFFPYIKSKLSIIKTAKTIIWNSNRYKNKTKPQKKFQTFFGKNNNTKCIFNLFMHLMSKRIVGKLYGFECMNVFCIFFNFLGEKYLLKHNKKVFTKQNRHIKAVIKFLQHKLKTMENL